jgi:hypothetical protein
LHFLARHFISVSPLYSSLAQPQPLPLSRSFFCAAHSSDFFTHHHTPNLFVVFSHRFQSTNQSLLLARISKLTFCHILCRAPLHWRGRLPSTVVSLSHLPHSSPSRSSCRWTLIGHLCPPKVLHDSLHFRSFRVVPVRLMQTLSASRLSLCSSDESSVDRQLMLSRRCSRFSKCVLVLLLIYPSRPSFTLHSPFIHLPLPSPLDYEPRPSSSSTIMKRNSARPTLTRTSTKQFKIALNLARRRSLSNDRVFGETSERPHYSRTQEHVHFDSADPFDFV